MTQPHRPNAWELFYRKGSQTGICNNDKQNRQIRCSIYHNKHMIQEVYNFNTEGGSLSQCMLPNFKKTPISNKLYNLKYTKFSAKLQLVIVITLVKFNNGSVPKELEN